MCKSLGRFCRTSVCLKTFCIFMWLSVEIYINHKNSSSNLDLKTRYWLPGSRIWTWRPAIWWSTSAFLSCHIDKVCFFFRHWGLCLRGGHNYSLSRQNGGLIEHVAWGFSRWLQRCMGIVTSHCASLGLLGSKKCVIFFFFIFCAKYAHMCIDENPDWFHQSCIFF